MKYTYSYILLLATFSNFLNSMVLMNHFDSWYDMIHKWQGFLILIAGPFYRHNMTNFLAVVGYAVIWVMNWIFYHFGGGHWLFVELSIWSGYLYVIGLIIMIIREKWKT